MKNRSPNGNPKNGTVKNGSLKKMEKASSGIKMRSARMMSLIKRMKNSLTTKKRKKRNQETYLLKIGSSHSNLPSLSSPSNLLSRSSPSNLLSRSSLSSPNSPSSLNSQLRLSRRIEFSRMMSSLPLKSLFERNALPEKVTRTSLSQG